MTAADLNAEYNNIIDNALSLISPLTASLAAGGFDITGLDELAFDDAAADASAGFRLRRNSRRLTLHDGVDVGVLSSVLYVDSTQVGNVGGGTDTLMIYTLPANLLNANNRVIRVTGWGNFAANANTKTLRFSFGATTQTLNPATTAPNNVDWWVQLIIIRTGATAHIMRTDSWLNGAAEGYDMRDAPTDDTTATIALTFDGNSAASATNDILQRGMIVELLN